MSKFLSMFRMLRKQGFLVEQMHALGLYVTTKETPKYTKMLDLLKRVGFTNKEIVGFGQWIYKREITNDSSLTTKEVLELTVSGFSNHVLPSLVRTYHKSKNADEAIAAFYFLLLLGVEGSNMFKNGSEILLSSAKHACSYDLDDSQRVVVKSILAFGLEPAVESFDERDAEATRALLDSL